VSEPAEVVELVVDSLAAGGDGVARDSSGRVTFVSHSAPGDRLRARVVEKRKSFARAVPVELLEPSPDRVEPDCELFAQHTCGGCQWQHLAPAAQLRAKQELVTAALRHQVAKGLEVADIEAPVSAYGWRRRARLHWVRQRRAKAAVLGFFAPRSQRVVDVRVCPQLEPAVQRALDQLREDLAPKLTGRGEIELVAGHSGEIHVAVRGPCSPRTAEALVGRGQVAGVVLGRSHWGADTIELEPELRGRADWFAQPSLAGNAALIAAVDRASSPRADIRICELYAGSGNLTRVLSRGAREVLAVDTHSAPSAFPGDGVVTFRQGTAAEATSFLARKGEPFDLAVLDPPRTGAADVMRPLIGLAPARIIYVSCDPATLARDVSVLVDAGYRATAAQPLDLMPQTSHVEVVMSLERSE